MNTRLSIQLVGLVSVLLFSGCATELHGGTLVIGGTTFAENKQILGGSHQSEQSKGPGYKSSSYQGTTRMAYTLGRGKDRRECTSDQSYYRSRYQGGHGVTTTTRNGSQFWCYPAPGPEEVAAALSPVKGAECKWEESSSGKTFSRTCTLASEAQSVMICHKSWTEVWSDTGLLIHSGYDTVKP